MAPLIVLIVTTLVFRLLGRWVAAFNSWPAAVRVGLAVMFTFTAMAHFNDMRHDMANMLPPWVPNPELVVILTGLLEVAGAIGLLIPKTRRAAAIGLVLFLIAVFPANVHAAQEGVLLRGQPATPLIPRALMQILFIGLTWWSGFVATRR
ncbi:MAG TPA: DoxX family protein [Thermoanaerobaculia bacterium]|nr:DoxX family protein [Thermoanaerobaculia bacterium]